MIDVSKAIPISRVDGKAQVAKFKPHIALDRGFWCVFFGPGIPSSDVIAARRYVHQLNLARHAGYPQ